MDRKEILAVIQQVAEAEELGHRGLQVTEDTKLEEVCADSLDFAVLWVQTESEVNIHVPDEEIEGYREEKTVGDFISLLIKYQL